MFKKRPHSLKIVWRGTGTISTSTGIFTPGTLTSVTVPADIQPATGSFIRKEDGAALDYTWKIFTNPFTEAASVPDSAKLTFFSGDHVLVQLFEYQKHVELKCRD